MKEEQKLADFIRLLIRIQEDKKITSQERTEVGYQVPWAQVDVVFMPTHVPFVSIWTISHGKKKGNNLK